MKTHVLNLFEPGGEPAYVSNGMVGLRVPALPFPRGTALVNGLMGVSPEKGLEEIAEAIYPVGADLAINGVWLSEKPACAQFRQQRHDFACGELHSVFDFAADGVVAHVETLLFCSRTAPTVTLQETVVTVDKPCTLTLQAHLDPRGVAGRLRKCVRPGNAASPTPRDVDGFLLWETREALATLGAGYACEYEGDGLQARRRNDYGHEEDMLLTQFAIAARPGGRHVMRQYGSLVPSLLHAEPHLQAARHVTHARMLAFDSLRAANRAAWEEIWQGRVRITAADERWQDRIDAAHYYLHSSIHRSAPCSVAPFGLSQRTSYSGHVFWDTESFIFPAALLTAPDAARAMLDYRVRMLPAARDNARLNGYRGLQFPWQSGLTGGEVTPYYCAPGGGIHEQFVIPCIAFAFAQYLHATGDDLFRRQSAWPVLEGIADWICSRVLPTPRGYEILHVVGNDESVHDVDNHALTNGLCAWTLREAARQAEALGMTPPARWRDIAEGLFLPVNPQTGALEKHEHDPQHLTKAGPDTAELQFFPFECPVSETVAAATLRHQLSLAHTYLGMPMHSSYFAVWAAQTGDRALAGEFLDQGTASRFIEPYFQFIESSKPGNPWANRAATFITGLAGLLNACLLGFPGVTIGSGAPETWPHRPVTLPEGWERIEVDRLIMRGKHYRLTATHGADRAILAAIPLT